MNEEKDVIGEAAVAFLKMIGAFAVLGFSIAFGDMSLCSFEWGYPSNVRVASFNLGTSNRIRRGSELYRYAETTQQ